MSTYIVGIDPSTKKLAVSTYSSGVLKMQTYILPEKDRRNTRTAQAYLEVFHHLASLRVKDAEEGGKTELLVFVEAPIIIPRHIKGAIELAQLSGALQAAITHSGADLVMVDNSRWKMSVVGRGNADKPQIAAWLRKHHVNWWRAASGDQDLMDSACIAIYGQKVYENRVKMKERLNATAQED